MTTSTRSSKLWVLLAILAVTFFLLVGCGGQPPPTAEQERATPPPTPPAAEQPPAEAPTPPEVAEEKPAPTTVQKSLLNPSSLNEQAPEEYTAKFDTSKGVIRIQVTREWAPIGADRFYNLVKNGFYDDCRFFRIVPNFVVQFGLNGDPQVNHVWREQRVRDDAVTKTNRLGTLTFATGGPNTRTTQVFINLKANPFLDSQGFSPFGQVTEGMDIVQSLNASYGEAPDQSLITSQGNSYLKQRFPALDYIKKATIE